MRQAGGHEGSRCLFLAVVPERRTAVTRVGQILVILLTCFSILFMGFAVTVFTTRTNWRENYNKKKAELDELNKKKQATDQQVKTLTEFITNEAKTHETERKNFNQQITDQQKNYTALNENYKQARSDVVIYLEQAERYGAQAKIRTDEAILLRGQLEEARKKKDEAQKIQFDTQQKHIELQGSYETLVARAKDLEQRVGDLTSIMQALGLSTNPKDHADKLDIVPPPVEGIVLEVDKEGKIVKISIGSDDGLRKKHRLQVYRVKPLGKFVATIEIIEVDPDQAVGRVLSQFKQGNIQEGDLVATRITASR